MMLSRHMLPHFIFRHAMLTKVLFSTLSRSFSKIPVNSYKYANLNAITSQFRCYSTVEDYDDRYLDTYGTFLLDKAAPDFTKQAVFGNGEAKELNFKSYRGSDFALLLFYPLNFTFVCPSELLAFAKREAEFKSRGVKLLGVSVDSVYSHQAWKKLPLNLGGVPNVGFPLVSDLDHSLALSYGVLNDNGHCNRATVLVDNKGFVVHYSASSAYLGRSVDEALRVVDAVKYHQANGEVCPADWKKGNKGFAPDVESTANFLRDLYGKN